FRPSPRASEQGNPTPKPENEEAWAIIWSIYVGEAERYDSALVQSWKADMEGMLIFSGLFSASLTAFIIESYKTLQPDTGDLTVAALTQVSQQIAALAAGETLAMQPTSATFHPPLTSLLCNCLWFISLALSLACALLATLVEQWARDFLHKTDMRPSPIRRARVFSFLYFGLKRFRMHTMVDVIPFLLHASLVLFFVGLIIFLVPVNRVVMYIMAVTSLVFLILYVVLTVLPLIHLDCPYQTPLSAPLWSLLLRLRRPSWLFPSKITGTGVAGADVAGTESVEKTRTEGVLDRAMELPDDRDQLALRWTLDSLTDDAELLPFVEAIPDVIYGPNGVRGTKDSLFIPLLGDLETASPLVTRICNLISSTRGLRSDDPLRARRQTAGFKCLWALAMMPVAWDMRFDTSHIASFFLDSADPLRKTTLLALQHHDLQWGRRLISRLRDILRQSATIQPEVWRLVDLILELQDRIPYPQYVAPRGAVSHLPESTEWNALSVEIIISWLKSTFDLPVAHPFEPLSTCNHILAELTSISSYVPSPSSDFYLPNLTQILQSPSFQTPGINEVDTLMRIAFRLLPYSSTATTRSYVNYLYHRNSKDAVLYVLRDCDTRRLSSSLCDQIRSYSQSLLDPSPLWARLSHSIAVLISVYPPSEAVGFADKVLGVVNENTHVIGPSDFTFVTVYAVKRLRGLEALSIELQSTLDHPSLQWSDTQRARVQALCQDNLLRPHCPFFIPKGTDLRAVCCSLHTQILNQYFLSVAWFLDHCSAQHGTAQLASTAFDFLHAVGTPSDTDIWAHLDPEAQAQFCASVLRFIRHIAADLDNLDQRIVGVAVTMWRSPIFWQTQSLRRGGRGNAPIVNPYLCDFEPSCVDTIIEALVLYQKIARGTSMNTSVSDEVLTWITDPVVTAWAKSRWSRRGPVIDTEGGE
ncbi:hypothetical protein DFH09DRAFT_1150171, partial [Mycena vulgaris]